MVKEEMYPCSSLFYSDINKIKTFDFYCLHFFLKDTTYFEGELQKAQNGYLIAASDV